MLKSIKEKREDMLNGLKGVSFAGDSSFSELQKECEKLGEVIENNRIKFHKVAPPFIMNTPMVSPSTDSKKSEADKKSDEYFDQRIKSESDKYFKQPGPGKDLGILDYTKRFKKEMTKERYNNGDSTIQILRGFQKALLRAANAKFSKFTIGAVLDDKQVKEQFKRLSNEIDACIKSYSMYITKKAYASINDIDFRMMNSRYQVATSDEDTLLETIKSNCPALDEQMNEFFFSLYGYGYGMMNSAYQSTVLSLGEAKKIDSHTLNELRILKKMFEQILMKPAQKELEDGETPKQIKAKIKEIIKELDTLIKKVTVFLRKPSPTKAQTEEMQKKPATVKAK